MILKQLKLEALDMINIHSTISSLRRACSIGNVTVVESTKDVPRLYYVTTQGVESIHALNSDLTKFLIQKHIESAGSGDNYILKGIRANWIETEKDYNTYVDPSYREQYSWEDSKSSMPWLVINLDKPIIESTEDSQVESEDSEDESEVEPKVKLNITFSSNVNLGESVDKIGTVSEDRKSVDVEVSNYVMFEVINDLGLTGIEPIELTVETEDAIYNPNVD